MNLAIYYHCRFRKSFFSDLMRVSKIPYLYTIPVATDVHDVDFSVVSPITE